MPRVRESRYIVWRGNGTVRTWWDVRPGVKTKDCLGSALAAATGVSSGSAHTVSVLLLRAEVGGRALTDLASVTRAADVTLDGHACHCITRTVPRPDGDEQVTVFIDCSTFLVRKLVERGPLEDIEVESTTTYDARFDDEIPDQALEFAPPTDGKDRG